MGNLGRPCLKRIERADDVAQGKVTFDFQVQYFLQIYISPLIHIKNNTATIKKEIKMLKEQQIQKKK